MAWGHVEVSEQRIRFVVAASAGGRSMSAVCAEFGISRPTGYQWLKRFQSGGVSAVREQSRRPVRSPRQTAETVEQRIVALRQAHPDWGGRKLQVLLAREGLTVPSGTVHRVLLRRDLVRIEDRHAPAVTRFERERPNQLWQMDFKSQKGWGRTVGPLSVLDDASRYAILLEGTWTTRSEVVQERLEAAFRSFGLPDAMLMDHGTPWWNTQSAGGWTRLSVWLMKQGVDVILSGVRHPQTQGKVERFHGALELARRRRGLPEPASHQRWLDDFRQEYNHVRPHEALNMQTPASVWHPSQRRYQKEVANWSYPSGADVVRLESTGQLKLAGRRWQVAGPLAGEQVQLVTIQHRVLVFFRTTLVREIDLAGAGSTMVEPAPAKPYCKGCPETVCKGCPET
jgi:transposase InsO family protein